MVGRGGQADVAGAEAPCRRRPGVAGGENPAAGAADVAAGGGGLAHPDLVAVAVRVLLQQDGVGAVRDQAAGEQPHRLAGADRAGERMAGRGAADHGPARPSAPSAARSA